MITFAESDNFMFIRSKTYFLIIVAAVIIGAAFLIKPKLNRFISEKMQDNVSKDVSVSVEQKIQSEYNYTQNSENYDFTFLEFSSTGCASCTQMEPVLEAVKNSKEVKVNVVFMHIMKPENQDWMKYYGISAVPLQVLLDREGKEFYRHFGVISTEDLLAKFREHKMS